MPSSLFQHLPNSAALRRVRTVLRPWLRPALRALAALVALWVVLWLCVPWLARGPLEQAASAALGRPVTLGEIDVRPWSLEITLHRLAVGGGGDGPPLLSIERVYADVELQSLLRWAPVLDALEIDNPALHLSHLGGGRYDADDVIERLLAPTDPPPPEDSPPPRLALYNLALTGGRITFNDQSVNTVHNLTDLSLRVPFLSTLPSARTVKVQPLLSFVLNGSRFDSSAEGTPFAQTHAGGASVRWQGLDLAPYLAYLPAQLPVRVQAATLDLDLQLAFEQGEQRVLKLSGTAQARDTRLTDRDNAPLVAWRQLSVDLADVQPLAQTVRLSRVEWTAPVLSLQRDPTGRVNLARLGGTASPASAPPKPAAAPPDTASGSRPWKVAIEQVAVREGRVLWRDATTTPAAQLEATGLTLDASGLALPQTDPAQIEGRLQLAQGAQNAGQLAWKGQARQTQAELALALDGIQLPLAAPYLAQWLRPTLEGQLTGTLGVQWKAPPAQATGATGLTVTAGPLTLEQMALQLPDSSTAPTPPKSSPRSDPANRPVRLDKLEVHGLQLGLDARTVQIERLALLQPRATLERDTQGQWMWQHWPVHTASGTASGNVADPEPTPSSPGTPGTTQAPWVLQLGELSVQGGAVSFSDRAATRPVALEVTDLSLQARQLRPDSATPQPLTLSARIRRTGDPRPPGQLSYQGTLALAPLAAQGSLEATRLPLHAIDGYLAQQLALELDRADASYRGRIELSLGAQGPRLRVSGDAEIDQLRALATAASAAATPPVAGRATRQGDELVAWKRLGLRGIDLASVPGAAPRLAIRETSLTDFYARVAIDETGRLNLSELARPGAGAGAPTPAATATPAPPTAPTSPGPQLQLALGPVVLVNGQVQFSDNFIRPQYAADLTELTGRLGALATTPPGATPELAALELRGRAQGTGTLEITGQLNPLVQPPLLDITGKVRELELPPLSPYSVKYAGHGIERGKLGVDVSYRIDAQGQLTANNRLILQQLTFGDPVADAPTSLPVRLAVALLADRNGVIDIDLPVSGSLNDPQFRLGPIIGKLVLNLIGKALTSPFSLLAGALGGSDSEMSSVPFAPGSAALSPQAEKNLARVVQALIERPSLKITVTGTASLEQERQALQQAQLAQLLLAEKRRLRPQDTSPVQADEASALLQSAYNRADIAKPRNLVGLARTLTDAEMQALLLAHLPATEAQAAALAQERAEAVRDFLARQNLPGERIFVGAPRTAPPGDAWTPRTELSLAQ